jgi:hypothetical protein
MARRPDRGYDALMARANWLTNRNVARVLAAVVMACGAFQWLALHDPGVGIFFLAFGALFLVASFVASASRPRTRKAPDGASEQSSRYSR